MGGSVGLTHGRSIYLGELASLATNRAGCDKCRQETRVLRLSGTEFPKVIRMKAKSPDYLAGYRRKKDK